MAARAWGGVSTPVQSEELSEERAHILECMEIQEQVKGEAPRIPSGVQRVLLRVQHQIRDQDFVDFGN